MPSLYTKTIIRAPRAVVWQALVRKQDWLKWNTFLFDRQPDHAMQEGRSLVLSVRRTDGSEETEFLARVTRVQDNYALQWYSTAPGLRNEHSFELQDVGLNVTQYIHRDRFEGLLAPVVLPFIRQDELRGMRRMAQELRQYAEFLSS
jgi:hypothetical protein